MSLATPWWVNLLAFVPAVTYLIYRSRGLSLDPKTLGIGLTFGIAFGFVEAAVVVYLRAATGILSGPQVMTIISPGSAQQGTAEVLAAMPASLVKIEMLREAATMAMLVSVALLGTRGGVARVAFFLWTFATWDIVYYLGLWLTIGWPSSLRDSDVLFLIPQPWISQVWFPLVVSALTLAAVIAARKPTGS
ncbi:MAG: hypothetical protein ABSB82_05195 [Terriglobia bacterium]|jgi:hypothetical protein